MKNRLISLIMALLLVMSAAGVSFAESVAVKADGTNESAEYVDIQTDQPVNAVETLNGGSAVITGSVTNDLDSEQADRRKICYGDQE